MKKILSFALALAMTCALCVSAFADTEIYTGGGKVTVNPGEEKIIQFTGNFSGPYYIAFGDQGQVMWRGVENGTKDFSFNMNPISWVAEKHPGVQFINFPAKPGFVESATVQFAIPVNDSGTPSLYMINDSGTIVGVPGVSVVGTNNKKFEFKTSNLAATYIISSVDLSYETAPSGEDPEPTNPPPTTTDKPTTPPSTGEDPKVENPKDPSPQTGIEDMPYILLVAVGLAGIVFIAKSKKKDD